MRTLIPAAMNPALLLSTGCDDSQRVTPMVRLARASLLLLVAAAMVNATSAIAQTGSAALQNREFMSAALKALRVIDSMTEAPEQDSPGHIVAPRYVTEAVEAADDLARSRSELAVIDLLKGFLDDKISNNVLRHLLLTCEQSNWLQKHPDASDEFRAQALPAVRELALDTPPIREMDALEAACVDALKKAIRAGTSSKPQACSKAKLKIDIDDDFTFKTCLGGGN